MKTQTVEAPLEEAVKETEQVLSLEEAQAQARAARVAQGAKKRTVRIGRRVMAEVDADMPWPDIDWDKVYPTAYVAVIDKVGETLEDTEFHLDPEKLVGLSFAAPGANLPLKALYTVKAVAADGRLVQLPFEDQINNTGAADKADAIGLRKYERAGFSILIDWSTMLPIYCAAVDCWARAMVPELGSKYPKHIAASNSGFCSLRHQGRTLPNQFDEVGNIKQGLLSQGVTTTRLWQA